MLGNVQLDDRKFEGILVLEIDLVSNYDDQLDEDPPPKEEEEKIDDPPQEEENKVTKE